MRVAYYNPDMVAPKWPWLFCKYLPDIEFISDTCDNEVDFIYCGSVQCLSSALAAAEQYKKPVVCYVWDIPTLDIFPNHCGAVDTYLKQLKSVSLVLSASKYTQSVLQSYNISSVQVYHYVDVDAINLTRYMPKRNCIVQVGRIVPHKQLEVTVAAAGMLKMPLRIYGPGISGEYMSFLQDVAVKFNTDMEVNIYKKQTEVLEAIDTAAVLCHPSAFEGWGMPPIEAIYLGTPPIVSDLPVFREQYGDSMIYHKVGDAKDLSNKIEALLGGETSTYVETLRQKVSDYTPEKFAQRWLSIIKEHMEK